MTEYLTYYIFKLRISMNIKLLLCCLGLVLAVTADEQVTLIFGGDVMLSRMVD
jgi:hypothetical protein